VLKRKKSGKPERCTSEKKTLRSPWLRKACLKDQRKSGQNFSLQKKGTKKTAAARRKLTSFGEKLGLGSRRLEGCWVTMGKQWQQELKKKKKSR